jgi:DNA-directed RNA polymerase specialized sigma24 family protein
MALERLREQRPDWAGLIEHHYLSSYSWEEAARAMGVSEKTARREGERARLLLYREILKILNEEDITLEGPHGAAADE